MSSITLSHHDDISFFQKVARLFQQKHFPPELERQYDRATLLAISDLPPHLLRDIGVTAFVHYE